VLAHFNCPLFGETVGIASDHSTVRVIWAADGNDRQLRAMSRRFDNPKQFRKQFSSITEPE